MIFINKNQSNLNYWIYKISFANFIYPEYRNVLLSNLKSSTGLIYAINKSIKPEWIAQDINEILDTLIKYRSQDIRDILRDGNNKQVLETVSEFKKDWLFYL